MDAIRQRFEEKFIPVPDAGCWLWVGEKNNKGYGRFNVSGGTLLAHRASYVIHRGALPAKALVCHKCDTPSCVNPDHLFLGTYMDNMRDAMSKGRLVLPSRNPKPAIGEGVVAAIRTDSISMSERAVAKKYGVSKGTIYRIKNGIGAFAQPQQVAA